MVAVERPAFVPDASIDRAAMEALQVTIAGEARFETDLAFDPATVLERPPFVDGAESTVQSSVVGEWVGDEPASAATTASSTASTALEADPPVIAGVDQAFREDEAVSAVVATRGGEVVERVSATAPLEIPYVPGLLSFREGTSILAALQELTVEPDLLLVDGSGRIHYREAGLATHVGLTVDVPAIGVAKSLLCGAPTASTAGLAEGTIVPIAADDQMTTVDDAIVGAAVQTRQYDSPDRHVNPLYVSPGHRVDWSTAADLALATTAGYKLPEPIRLADRWVGELAS